MSLRNLVRYAVVATNPVWPWSAINRWPYRVAIATTRRRIRRIDGVRALHLRNGLTRSDWVPGLSDIDLTAVVEDGDDPEAEYLLLQALWARYASLKRVFPMLGELDVLSAATLGTYCRLGIAGRESRDWQPLFGDAAPGAGAAADALRLRADACDHAQFFCLDMLQQRYFEGAAARGVDVHAARRIAAKVLRYAALAADEPPAVLPRAVLKQPAVAAVAVALHAVDAAARRFAAAQAATRQEAPSDIRGAGAPLRLDEQYLAARPRPPDAAVDSIIDAESMHIVVLRDGLDPGRIEAALRGIAGARDALSPRVSVVTPAVLEHWVRHADPFLYTRLLAEGRVIYGRTWTLPAAPTPSAYARCVLAQAPNALCAARSAQLMPAAAGAFVASRAFELAVERALFIRTLADDGAVAPFFDELAAHSARRNADVLAQVDVIRAEALPQPALAGYAAFTLLRELADDTARCVERLLAPGGVLDAPRASMPA